MKKYVLSIGFLLLVSASMAQSDKYVKNMEKNIAQLDSAKTPATYLSLAAMFERIADAEKNKWLPYYYAAFAHIMQGFNDVSINKDEVAAKADELIAKALSLDPNNADLYVLKNMSLTLRMLVNPGERYMKLAGDLVGSLETAKKIDPNNPRIYLMEGQRMFGTPKQFGGGKEVAKPIFEKSVALFDAQQPKPLYPNWGKMTALNMLEKCK